MKLSRRLLKGSGLWLTGSRVPAFAAWEEKATPPHNRTSATSTAGPRRPSAAKAISAETEGTLTK